MPQTTARQPLIEDATMPDSLDRRDFHKLTAAALSGLAAGAILGCGGQTAAPPAQSAPGDDSRATAAADVHLCRGLNECKGQGKGGENACRGQGACATAKEHACSGQNECKGLGGCGGKEGANACKGQGGCHVPLMEGAWETLRKKKDAEWAAQQLEAGQPPPAKES
jgi:hypothetical protein